MVYEYTGYLSTLLYAPDADARDSLEHITFSSDDLAGWTARDMPQLKEWQRTPVQRVRTEHGVRVVGKFHEIRQIDNLPVDDPRFWAPLGSFGKNDSRFPVDLERFPVCEITYRCVTDNAYPAWVWTYGDCWQTDFLEPTPRWRTAARLIPHNGFPQSIDGFVFRVYSNNRSDESVELESLRFRALTAAEQEAIGKDTARRGEQDAPKHYPILDEFMPLGTYLNAEVSRRMAELLGLSMNEYWQLVFEDLVRHHHNCVAMEKAERFTAEEFREFLRLADAHDVKVAAIHNAPLADDVARSEEFLEANIAPYADEPALLAWILCERPKEESLNRLLHLKRRAEEMSPGRPVALLTQGANGYPLFAPYFAASGLTHDSAHDPWTAGAAAKQHRNLAGGQQFWMVAPAYVSASSTPEWSSCAEMRLMANLAMANGARGWFSYAYHNDPVWITGSCQRTLTGPFLAFSDLWLELDKRMGRFDAIAPLLLAAAPAPLPEEWYFSSQRSADHTELPEGAPATSYHHLRGDEFDLYFVISNDVRGMTSVDAHIPPEALGDLEIYDLSDFVHTWNWAPMRLERHVEMFPGQARIVLVAKPAVCAYWRDVIARRLIEDDKKHVELNLTLARAHDIDTQAIDVKLASTGQGDILHDLVSMHAIRAITLNLLYQTPRIAEPRSKIIEVCAAVCACDGALCRLIHKGKAEMARELGMSVLPIAREFTKMRLELRQGKGADITAHCETLAKRALQLLEEIRSHV